jgi:DNA-binding response OmpR family regulator
VRRLLQHDISNLLRDADVVLLNLAISELDGIRTLHSLRRCNATVPIIVQASRVDENSVVRWLGRGADDYAARPTQPTELVARIEALSRRARALGPSSQDIVSVTDVVVDLGARVVKVGPEEISLTTKEFEVLAVLARMAGTAVSRRQIMEEVWGDCCLAVSKTLGVHMAALRAKLGRRDLLQTVHGFGYRLG